MTSWPNFPTVYEINTWVWLDELSRAAAEPLTLADVPQAELERIGGYGLDGVWLMGVWQRSVAGRKVAREHPDLQPGYQQALPGFTAEDVVGSPYAVYEYRVDEHLGGDEALATLRRRLADLGLRLMLDFVPNHLAVDHRWLAEHPDWLVQGGPNKLAREPDNYFQTQAGGQWRVFAHGRDPYFAGWTDTVQLDYRPAAARRAMADILLSIADRCDGLRCDMAMLVDQAIFRRTWGGQFDPPRAEFWLAAITDLRARHPGFLMLAEVYWDMEWELQQQGFNYTYDKRLYDWLVKGDAMDVRLHLTASLDYQGHLARFIENHDEPRAAEALGLERSKAAAVLALTLPGFRLLHEGQLQGRRLKLPVQLGRRQPEEAEPGLEALYGKLLAALKDPVFHEGIWRLLRPQPEWEGNFSHRNAVAHLWSQGDAIRVIIVNLSGQPAQFFLPVDLPRLAGRDWQLLDQLNDQAHVRSGAELVGRGLYVDLDSYGYHLFELRAAEQ